MTSIPTKGGIATRGEAYVKLNYHLIECQELAAVMSHLHNTEQSAQDLYMAKAWLQISDNFKRTQEIVMNLAMGKLQ
jgi:hypothetical protein